MRLGADPLGAGLRAPKGALAFFKGLRQPLPAQQRADGRGTGGAEEAHQQPLGGELPAALRGALRLPGERQDATGGALGGEPAALPGGGATDAQGGGRDVPEAPGALQLVLRALWQEEGHLSRRHGGKTRLGVGEAEAVWGIAW